MLESSIERDSLDIQVINYRIMIVVPGCPSYKLHPPVVPTSATISSESTSGVNERQSSCLLVNPVEAGAAVLLIVGGFAG